MIAKFRVSMGCATATFVSGRVWFNFWHNKYNSSSKYLFIH